MKKILILYTSIGLGHKSIAENIGWHLERAGFVVRLEDIGKVENGKFGKVTIKIHGFINEHLPFIWGWIYRWGFWFGLPFRLTIASFNYKNVKTVVDEFNPNLIITTQTTASAAVAYLKKRGFYKNKFAIAFSDYHLHRFWLYDRADFYLVNIEEQKQEMVKLGIPKGIIFVCGAVLKPKLSVDAKAVKQKFDIEEDQSVVLVGTGSLGVGFKQKDLTELTKLPNTKIIFACGKNRKLFESIKSLNYPNIIPLSFYTPMDELYAIADIFVGKPGGLSTAEAMLWNLPLLITFTLPGQEQKNVEYLAGRKLIMPSGENLISTVEQELKSHNFKHQLQTNPYVPEIIGRVGTLVAAVKTYLEL